MNNSIIPNIYFLFIQTRKILFSGKFYYFLVFGMLYNMFFLGLFHFEGARMGLEEAFYSLNLVPMLVYTLYLSMTIVGFEQDNGSIETMFAIPGSPYKVWLYKIFIMYFLIFLIQLALALISFFFIMDFSIPLMLIGGFVPLFFVANVTFYFSTVFRNGYAAGLVSVLICFFNFILGEELYYSKWWLFLSPFNKPQELDYDVWNTILMYNKFGLTFISLVFLFLGLRKLLNREPFID